jgi:cytochrome c-type biogenesis protein
VVIVMVAGLGMYLSLGQTAPGGDKAPGFNLTDVNGKSVSLSNYRGSVVVLDMMATWCPTCNQEIPELKDFHSKHPDVIIISIDVDKAETSAQLKSHMESKGASWISCKDTDNVMQKYQVTEIPKLVVITPSGEVTFMKAALVRSDELATVTGNARTGSAPILALGGETGFAVLAFLAGISAFFSPCAFPLLPGYMSFYIGRGKVPAGEDAPRESVKKSLSGGLAAAAGVLAIYAVMGIIVGLAGSAVKPVVGYLMPVVAVVIVIMGIIMLSKYDLPLYRITAAFKPLTDRLGKALRPAGKDDAGEPGYYSGLVSYGAGYGAASLGCHAPIFIAVVMGGLQAGGFGSALLAFLMYGIGMGIFMVIVTVLVGMGKNALVRRLQYLMPTIKKVSGVVLVVVGIVLVYYYYISVA